MRLNPVVTLFVAAHLCCVNAGPVQEARQLSYSQRKCRRMFSWTEGEGVSKCTYMCKGFPFRWENEPDGVSCRGGDGDRVCMNGKCVKRELSLSTPTYTTTFTKSPTTPKSAPSADVSSILQDTMMSTSSSDKLVANSDVPEITQRTLTTSQQTTRHRALTSKLRDETLEMHAVSSTFSTGTQAHTTVNEWTTAHAVTSFEGLSTARISRTPKKMVTTSSNQDAQLSSRTDELMIPTQEASSDRASSTPRLVTTVHHGNPRADDDLMQTDTLSHKKGDFTEGPTTAIPHAPTSWKERSIATANPTPEETVTSSSHQGSRLSGSTDDPMIRTQEVSSHGASSTPILVTAAHNGKTRADHDLMQTDTFPLPIEDFTEGPTTVIPHAPTSWKERSVATAIPTPEETATSSSHQGARLSGSTDDPMIRTQEVSSDGASSTPRLVTALHHGHTRADYDLMQTDTLPHQKEDFTEGPTTVTPHAPTSWKERSVATANPTPKETVTSSSHQRERLSGSTDDPMIRTQEASSDRASSTPRLVTALHHGKTRADYDLIQTDTLSHRKGYFTEGPTTVFPHAPTSWKERSIATTNTTPEETVTSSSHQGARLPASTESTNATAITVIRTHETSTDVASTSPCSLISVHDGTPHADHDEIQAFTSTHQNGGFADVPTTVSRRSITSPGKRSAELRSSPTHVDVHIGPVSDVVPCVRVSTKQAVPSAYQSTATSTSTSKQYFVASGFLGNSDTPGGILRESDFTPHPTSTGTNLLTTISLPQNDSRATSAERDNVSVLIASRNTTPNDFSFRANSTTSSHNLFTRGFQDREQAVTEANEGDISAGDPTLSDQLLTDSSSAMKLDITTDSADTEEPSTKMSYATNAETKISGPPVRAAKISTTSGSITFNQSAGTDVPPIEVATASKTWKVGISTPHPTSTEPQFFRSVGSTREEISPSVADADIFPGKEWDTSADVIISTSQRKATKQSFTVPVSSTDIHYDPEVEQETTVPSVKWENEASTRHPTTLTLDSTTSAQSINQDISSRTAHGTRPSNKEGDESTAFTTITSEQLATEQSFLSSIFIPNEQYTPQAKNQNATATIMPHLPTMQSEDVTSSKWSPSADISTISTDIKTFSRTKSVAKTTSQPGTTEDSFKPPGLLTNTYYAPHNTQKTAIATEDGETHLSTHHFTMPYQDLTSYAKQTNEDTSPTSADIESFSTKTMDALPALSENTNERLTAEPIFADPAFTTHQHHAHPDEEQSTAVILDELVSTHNVTTPNFGLPTSAVSIPERSPSTSQRAEWPSRTEKAALEETSTNNNKATTTQNATMASTFSAPGYHTAGRAFSGGVQPIATTSFEDDSTGESANFPQNATSFPSSSKEATSNTAHTVSSSTEIPKHSEPEGSSEQETSAEKVSSAPASAASAKYSDPTKSPDNKSSSATREKGDTLRGSTAPSLQVTHSPHSRSEECKSELSLHRQKAMLLAFCAIFLFVTILKVRLRKRETV